jgi:hypothetical protein
MSGAAASSVEEVTLPNPKPGPESPPPEQRGQGFARIAGGLMWAFALGFLLGAVQVGKAMWSHKAWMNYRGEVISQTTLRWEFIFFFFGSVFCALLAWHWHRTWRSRS